MGRCRCDHYKPRRLWHGQHVVNNAGLLGIALQQDAMEYNSMTRHTNLDTYERIVPEDVKEAAVVVAAGVLHLADREQIVPRFSKDRMPAPVQPRDF